jgi:predicted NUDIX family phosphoesterase
MKNERLVLVTDIYAHETERTDRRFLYKTEDEIEDLFRGTISLIPKSIAETDDLGRRQIIPYVILYRHTTNGIQVCSYQRVKGQGDKRLEGERSLGFAGHVELEDCHDYDTETVGDALFNTVVREMHEEAGISMVDMLDASMEDGIKAHGIIIDNTNEIGKVHLGILTTLRVSNRFHPLEESAECKDFQWHTVGEGMPKMESWSEAIKPFLCDLLNSKE